MFLNEMATVNLYQMLLCTKVLNPFYMEFVQISFINLATTKVFLRGFAWQDKIKKVQCHRNVSKECSNLFYVDCVDYCSTYYRKLFIYCSLLGVLAKKTSCKETLFFTWMYFAFVCNRCLLASNNSKTNLVRV